MIAHMIDLIASLLLFVFLIAFYVIMGSILLIAVGAMKLWDLINESPKDC